ncbi:hypothetical protein [Mangrovimonas sp. DI 80]|uniref:hypothetical protein n=1 Tax=Mangrovimonas sp. DI 80 TaxID=1779330 RepID=UPI000F4F7E11|nr:hypothetical protein [Mangrovimonas sp. DI 80]
MMLLLMMSCGPSMTSNWLKPNLELPKYYGRIAVIAVSSDLELKEILEKHIGQKFEKHGMDNVVYGSELFKENITQGNWDEGYITKTLKQNRVDGAIVVSYLGDLDVPEYSTEVLYGAPANQRLEQHVNLRNTEVPAPDYYTSGNKKYWFEAFLYDLSSMQSKEEALIWKGQSSVSSPSSVKKGAKRFSKVLVDHLYKKEILK